MDDRQPILTVKDPVGGMDVDPATAKHTSEYRGETYAFCSLMCKNAFEDDPRRYLNQDQDRRGGSTQAPGRR